MGRGARLPRARGVGAPRLARRLPAGAPRPRGGAGGAHPAPPDPGRGADPPAPRSRSSSRSRWRCSISSRAGASPTSLAVGYREEEYAMFGRDFARARAAAWTRASRRCAARARGEAFEFEGRMRARAAAAGDARRAAAPHRRREPRGGAPRGALRPRHADPGRRSFPRRALPRRVRAARPRAGPLHRSAAGTVTSAFVAEDPDAAWERLGPYLLHDARMYAAWLGRRRRGEPLGRRERGGAARPGRPLSHLHARGGGGPRAQRTACCCSSRSAAGCPPALAWEHLELVGKRVVPALGSPA